MREKNTQKLNPSSKGLKLELTYSKCLHAKGIPFLISSKFLRRLKAGQVDIAHYYQGKIFFYEIKSSEIGIAVSQKKQRERLFGSKFIVEEITQKEVILKYLKKGFAN